MTTRRNFLRQLSIATGACILMPAVSSCGAQSAVAPDSGMIPPPLVPPTGWDPIAFNRTRGNAGAIPDTYLDDINGPVGETDHLGKHLPYVPEVDASMVPTGFVAVMWGDPSKGHAAHPNAERGEANNFEGHWYNWIRIRKAVSGEAEETQSTYAEWPGETEDSTGAYAVYGGGDIRDNSGKNTIYLAALPPDVRPGDTVRIHAHCLTHGEYVDFITV